MDLSCPFDDSVNDVIDRECHTSQFCTFDDAVSFLQKVGIGAEMAKQDVKHTFRLVPVRPADWDLLGYELEGYFFIDTVLPFGFSPSPFSFLQDS